MAPALLCYLHGGCVQLRMIADRQVTPEQPGSTLASDVVPVRKMNQPNMPRPATHLSSSSVRHMITLGSSVAAPHMAFILQLDAA